MCHTHLNPWSKCLIAHHLPQLWHLFQLLDESQKKRRPAIWRTCTPLLGFQLFSERILSALFHLMQIPSFTNWCVRGETFHSPRPDPCKWLPLAFVSPRAGVGQQGGWLGPPGKRRQTLGPEMQPENRQVARYLWR